MQQSNTEIQWEIPAGLEVQMDEFLEVLYIGDYTLNVPVELEI